MNIPETRSLFAWDCLEDNPTLATISAFLKWVPDVALLEGLRRARGNGRNDYPVHVLWGTVLLTIALRHQSIEACLAELRRNEQLRRLIGIDTEQSVPKKWNMSRFMEVLGSEPHRTMLEKVFNGAVARLGSVVSDLGTHCAGDATGLSARGDKGDEGNPDGLPQPSGGRKEYTDDEGKVTRIIEWFGYKLHLLVDTRHEVALGYFISSSNTADNEGLHETVARASQNMPEGRIKTVAFDKAADDSGVHAFLADQRIKPVIENRRCWVNEFERPVPGHEGSNIVHDEAGTVYCYDIVSEVPVRHKMSYNGYESATQTIKYRCPARQGGWKCPCDGRCNAGKKYGKTVRIKCAADLRRFPPIPRATKTFERLYKGRTAVERVNARLKIFWGADDGNITGAARFHALLGTVMVVHIGFATLLAGAPRHTATLCTTRITPVAQALHAKST